MYLGIMFSMLRSMAALLVMLAIYTRCSWVSRLLP